ncbi:hypothetical protein DV735_g185, partial [Chaetothyriales sp. CBS 134920]
MVGEEKESVARRKKYHRRSPVACDECRLRKKKCDGVCSYQFRRPARPPTQRIRDLEEHLRYAQNFIKALQTKVSDVDDVDFDSVLGVLDFSAPASLSSPIEKSESLVRITELLRLTTLARGSVFSQSDVDIRQLANVERDLRNWANDAVRLFDGLGPVLKHEMESTYLLVQIALYMPFLHYLRVMAAGAAISLNQSQHALACLKVASTTILKTETAMNSGAFSILKMVIRRLQHTVDFDIDQVEASTPRWCQRKIVDSVIRPGNEDEDADPQNSPGNYVQPHERDDPWRLPPSLDPEWIAFEVYTGEDDDETPTRKMSRNHFTAAPELTKWSKDLEAFTSSYRAMLQRVQALDGQIQDLTADLQNETNSRRLWQNRAEEVEYRVSKNQYVLALVDGNQTSFRAGLIQSGSSETEELANRLVSEVREVARRQHTNDLSDDFSVLITIFVDLEKLSQDLIAAGSIPSAQQLKDFINDLMAAQALITVIDWPQSDYYETLDMYSEDEFTKSKTSLLQPENGFPSQYSLPFHTATFSVLDTVRSIPFSEIASEANGTVAETSLEARSLSEAPLSLQHESTSSNHTEPSSQQIFPAIAIITELKPDGGVKGKNSSSACSNSSASANSISSSFGISYSPSIPRSPSISCTFPPI